jgi:meiotic recombination protein SPO11
MSVITSRSVRSGASTSQDSGYVSLQESPNKTLDFLAPALACGRDQYSNFAVPIAEKNKRPGAVICRIEDIISGMMDAMSTEKELVLFLKSSRAGSKRNAQEQQNERATAVRWPAHPKRFTMILLVLVAAHQALLTGKPMTRRELYYQQPSLWGSQAVVDRYVKDVAYTLGFRSEELNIVPAGKGLVAGQLTFTKDNAIIDCRDDGGGMMLPTLDSVDSFNAAGAGWVLVIEKEATFRTLVHNRFWENCLHEKLGGLSGKGILITGKGYPDENTKQWVKLLAGPRQHRASYGSEPGASTWHRMPVFGLVDFDPDGYAILAMYKNGALSLDRGDVLPLASQLTCIGVCEEWICVLQNGKDPGPDWLRMSVRDRRLAASMLEKSVFQDMCEPEWRRALQTMLMLNIKAEIQIAGEYPRLESLLRRKMEHFGTIHTCPRTCSLQIDQLERKSIKGEWG